MTATAARPTARHRGGLGLAAALAVSLLALGAACAASILLGSRAITAGGALTPTELTVLFDMRVPRTVLGLLIGAALAVSGALLQGVARNPLADPGVLGINSGAALAVVAAVTVAGSGAVGAAVWFAFLGAGVATVTVYGIASFGREGATPTKLALAGVVVTAAASSLTSAIVLMNVDALNELRFWQVGALAGRYWPVIGQLWPFLVGGLVVAMLAARPLNALALGDDLARSLGTRVRLTRGVLFAIVAVLCGAATAACGPIAFVGLMVPHLARLLAGPDYRWILPFSLVLGPTLLLACDVLGRMVIAPAEVQVGVIVGIVGAPVFVALVRMRRSVEL
ncbi:iron ABC transporter permease [Agromyces intestinalis]|uniref:Iron ABC transporter permease n=1 Tax=Agromyces intestinalis TaxID=2592652 RepID=A0A5C1YJM4_9MICO|nr:iron ABC transporter permease [Agromyces intestinalis]QEO15349.1 iron ABC transporter permease [Agromyces intestinalis]